MKKRFLSILTLLCMTIALLPVNITVYAATSGTCGDNLTWTLDDSGMLTISGTGDMYDWRNYEATPWYSNKSSIKSIDIQNGVTSIGNGAFYDCAKLTNITISDSVKSIGEYTFCNCSRLTSINIPNSVTKIGSGAFKLCSSLTSITIPDEVKNIGENLFYSCENLSDVMIGKKVKSIGESAFFGCSSLISIDIPNSVTSIGDYAFRNCNKLASITIGKGITSIGSWAFIYCNNLKKVNISDISAWCKISFKSNYSNPLYFANKLYLNDNEVTNLTIPDGTSKINFYAFCNCKSLTSITIPNSMTSIDSSAFSDCSSLTDVYYVGTESDWNNISIGSDNTYLTNATRTYVTCTQTTVFGKTFTVTPINIASGNTVIIALYNGETLVDTQSKTYLGESLEFTTEEDYTNAKVFVWGSVTTAAPICTAEIVK